MSSLDVSFLTTHGSYVQRVVLITAASLSIFAGVLALAWWYITPLWRDYANRRHLENPSSNAQQQQHRPWRIKQFRHDLTISLIVLDLIKAVLMIMYPVRFLHFKVLPTSQHTLVTFCDAVGFLTVAVLLAIDFAVLALAVHTALLVFFPTFTGGLYRFRFIIYTVFFFILPLAFASIGFAGSSGYTFFSNLCYPVVDPIWYTILLGLAPRVIVMLLVMIIYFAIFIHVKVHMYQVSKAIIQANTTPAPEDLQEKYMGYHARSVRQLKRLAHVPEYGVQKLWKNVKILLSYLPGCGALHPLFYTTHEANPLPTAPSSEDFQSQINRENIKRFKRRRSIIERQVNSTLIYPLAYIFLYIFPIIQMGLHLTQKETDPRLDQKVNTVMWVSYIASWMTPFNCFVDTCVFFIREGAIPCLAQRKTSRNQPDTKRPDFVRSDSYHDEPYDYFQREAEIDYVIPQQPSHPVIEGGWVSNLSHRLLYAFVTPVFSVSNLFHHDTHLVDKENICSDTSQDDATPSPACRETHNSVMSTRSTQVSEPSRVTPSASIQSQSNLDAATQPNASSFLPTMLNATIPETDICDSQRPVTADASPHTHFTPKQSFSSDRSSVSPKTITHNKRSLSMPFRPCSSTKPQPLQQRRQNRMDTFHHLFSATPNSPRNSGQHDRDAWNQSLDPLSSPFAAAGVGSGANEDNDNDDSTDPAEEMDLAEFLAKLG